MRSHPAGGILLLPPQLEIGAMIQTGAAVASMMSPVCAAYFVFVCDRAHNGSHGQAVEVVVHKDDYAEEHG